jgi:hypothetical protein
MRFQAGRAVNIQHLGRIEPTALFEVVSPERHWESLLANAESLTREVNPGCSVLASRLIDDVLCIVDLKGFRCVATACVWNDILMRIMESLTKFWQVKNVIRDSFQISQDYYPETCMTFRYLSYKKLTTPCNDRLGHLAVINAPYGFSAIWAAVRPWVAKETQDKVHILGSDYQSGLLELVDAENLPESLGGKCTCTEYGGCELSKASPWMLDRERRREAWLSGERKGTGLRLDNEEDVKLVWEHYGNNLDEFTGKEKQVAHRKEVSTSAEKDVNKDVVVTETPVPQRVEATVN